jgi:acetyl-CoA acyltransferase
MDAYIVVGFRTAVGKAKRGGFRFTTPVDLGARSFIGFFTTARS